MKKPPSLDLQMEEVRRCIDDLPIIEGRHQRKSKIEFRQDILRAVCRTLDFIKQNEEGIRAYIAERKRPRVEDEISGAA
jgi:hypothetical protein